MATEMLCYETPTGAEIAGNSPEWQNLHGHHDQTPHEADHLYIAEEETVAPSSDEALEHVFSELHTIRSHLKEESKKLHKREVRVAEREKHVVEIEYLLHEAYATLQQYTEEELFLKWKQFREQADHTSEKLGEVLKNKDEENKRLKDSFDTLRRQNDALRKQLLEIQSKNGSLESQISHIQGRLTNLQRIQKLSEREHALKPKENKLTVGSSFVSSQHISDSQSGKEVERKVVKVGSEGQPHSTKRSARKPGSVHLSLEILGLLLEWVTEQRGVSGVVSGAGRPEVARESGERCSKVLSAVSDILGDVQQADLIVQRQFLQHIHWCLLEQSMGGLQKAPLSSTMRRIGNTMLGLQGVKGGGQQSSSFSSLGRNTGYCQSEDDQLRILASLIALKTVVQADHLAYVFDVLQEDLSNDHNKALFLTHKGVQTVLPFMKPGKMFCGRAVDIYLVMSVDSGVLQSFLSSLCCVQWFRACGEMLRAPHLDTAMLEKLSVVLQRVSKLWTSRKYFETNNLSSTIKELLMQYRSSKEGFVKLNFQSILHNLDNVQ